MTVYVVTSIWRADCEHAVNVVGVFLRRDVAEAACDMARRADPSTCTRHDVTEGELHPLAEVSSPEPA